MTIRNRVSIIRAVFLFGSALATLTLGGSGLAFGSTGCDLVNAVGAVQSGKNATSGAGKFKAGDVVKFLLPARGSSTGQPRGWGQVDSGPWNFSCQKETPTECEFVFDRDVDGQWFRFTNNSSGPAFPSCNR